MALAAILTGLIRRLLRTAPGFLFTAPTAGSGKTLLADVASMVCTGRTATNIVQGANDLVEGNDELNAVFLDVAAVKGKPNEIDTKWRR